MADTIWSVHPNSYIILEHWADNNEEKILADYGMMLWGNVTHGYQESGMGYISGSNLYLGIQVSNLVTTSSNFLYGVS